MILAAVGRARPDIETALTSGLASVGLLAVSAVLLRLEGARLADLGLPTNARRLLTLGAGVSVSAPLFFLVAWIQSLMVGASWSFQSWQGVTAAAVGLMLVTSMVLAEELLFRGLALRYLRAMCGDRAAIGLSAVLFGAYHLVGRDYWAMGAVFQFAMPALGGLLFGWAAVRSGGLALPIGLHLGGNWLQASVAGFSVQTDRAAVTTVEALWRIPISSADAQALLAPDLVPRLPYLTAIAAAAVLTRVITKHMKHNAIAILALAMVAPCFRSPPG